MTLLQWPAEKPRKFPDTGAMPASRDPIPNDGLGGSLILAKALRRQEHHNRTIRKLCGLKLGPGRISKQRHEKSRFTASEYPASEPAL